MKVLQVNKFNYLRGGADKYFLDLTDMLTEHGVETARFCMKHPNNSPSKESHFFVSNIDFNKRNLWQMLRYVGRVIYSFEAKYKFEKLIKEFKPDIIHIHNIYHQISPSILSVAKKSGVPVVMHVHDYKLVCPNYKMFRKGEICQRCQGGKYYKCFLSRCFKNSYIRSLLVTVEMYWHHKVLNIYDKNIDLYLCPSGFLKDKLIEWGVDKKKLKVVPHCIDAGKFKPNFNLGDYLLFFGRLEKEKGVDKLVEAMARVKAMKLKIVGFGPEHKYIKELIAKYKLESRVEVVGPKYGDELKEIISKSYTVIVPSQWYEVFGLVNLEAAALGKMVIASDIGGIPEVVKDKETALLFKYDSVKDLTDKLNWSIEHPEQVEKIAKKARAYTEDHFPPKKHLAEILSVYHGLAK